MRSLIQEGSAPSEFILRPEVAKVILSYDKPFVD
jgi:sulfate adenylyltransferase